MLRSVGAAPPRSREARHNVIRPEVNPISRLRYTRRAGARIEKCAIARRQHGGQCAFVGRIGSGLPAIRPCPRPHMNRRWKTCPRSVEPLATPGHADPPHNESSSENSVLPTAGRGTIHFSVNSHFRPHTTMYDDAFSRKEASGRKETATSVAPV